jgi:hypothetical protein
MGYKWLEMPPELVINAVTGFLDQSTANSFSVFSNNKKVKLLELADNYRRSTGKWPDLDGLCDAVGISMRSFYTHCEKDKAFKDAWMERLLRGEAKLTSKLADMSNPVGPLSVLRRYFPDRWNPEYKVTASVDVTMLNNLVDRAKSLDAEIVLSESKTPPPSSSIT